ncbi:MAG: hypothetical protein JWN78_557 [Bacteroidota bacterium]|nr:hypothetical protein [Bacteroidota bacterium]
MNDKTEIINKINKKSSILRVLGILLILLSLIIFLVLTTHQGDKILYQQKEIKRKNLVLSTILDSSQMILSKKDSLTFIVNELLLLRKEHNADSLEHLYSDTVINYFKNLHYAPKRLITISDKQYWKHYPNDKFILNQIKIISETEGDKAFINGKQCCTELKCVDEILEIHFDRNKKINYVRGFYAK